MNLNKGISTPVAIVLIVIVSAVVGVLVWQLQPAKKPISEKPGDSSENKEAVIGKSVSVDIQTPHPYPNSEGGRKIVWSDTLSHPKATFLRLHFDKVELAGDIATPEVYKTVDYGPCQTEQEIPSESEDEETQEQERRCGEHQVLKEFSPQEIFDNDYVKGDFLLVRNEEGKVIDIIAPGNSLQRTGNWTTIYPDTSEVTLLLYADQTEQAYGVHIDKYSAGLKESESSSNSTLK